MLRKIPFVAALAFATPAFAADLPSQATPNVQPPIPQRQTIGRGFISGREFSALSAKGVKGAFGGDAFAGYDHLFDNGFTLGVRFDAGYQPWLTPVGRTRGFDFTEADVKLGYQLGRLTPFVVTGVELGKATPFPNSFSGAGAVNGVFAAPGAFQAAGVVGAGVEYQLTNNIKIGVAGYIEQPRRDLWPLISALRRRAPRVTSNARPTDSRKSMLLLNRRAVLAGVVAASAMRLTSSALAQNNPPAPFGHADVVKRARDLAAAPFDATVPPLPEPFANLDFDAWRDIRFKSDQALLGAAKGNFRLELFHLGHLYKRPVVVNVLRDGIRRRFPMRRTCSTMAAPRSPGRCRSTSASPGSACTFPSMRRTCWTK